MPDLIAIVVVTALVLGAVAVAGERIPAIRPKVESRGFRIFKTTVLAILAVGIVFLVIVALVTLGIAIVQNLT